MLAAVKRSPNYKYWAFGALSIGMFSSVVDHGSVNIALPTVASHFNTGLQTIQWIVISYALTISTLLLPMGRMADIVGRTKIYVAGSIIFALAAGLAGAAPTLPMPSHGLAPIPKPNPPPPIPSHPLPSPRASTSKLEGRSRSQEQEGCQPRFP